VKEAFADDSGDNRKNKRKNNQVSQPDSHETPLQTAQVSAKPGLPFRLPIANHYTPGGRLVKNDVNPGRRPERRRPPDIACIGSAGANLKR
jgi:hypothetical protein